MGFFRALIQANPHSMSGGFYSSSWQSAKEETYGYLRNIRFDGYITSLNITNIIPNSFDLSDVNHPDFPVFGTSSNASNIYNKVNGINISNYTKLFLNSNCYHIFYSCRNCTDWSGLNLFDWTYVTNCSGMFSTCLYFNQPITIGQNVTDCSTMFYLCNNFNQPVTIGPNVTNCFNMFNGCRNFNQPITIPNSVTNCDYMFYNCRNFNQPVIIGSNVERCAYMFVNCNNFNQPVIIDSNVESIIHSMFKGCRNFNQSVTIGPNVINCYALFENSYTASFDLYIKGKTFRNISLTRACTNTSGLKNIWFNKVLQNQINKAGAQSLIGNTITWTDMSDGNGFYNEYYKIYCYNNYEG